MLGVEWEHGHMPARGGTLERKLVGKVFSSCVKSFLFKRGKCRLIAGVGPP